MLYFYNNLVEFYDILLFKCKIFAKYYTGVHVVEGALSRNDK